jgi:hypothetical protein
MILAIENSCDVRNADLSMLGLTAFQATQIVSHWKVCWQKQPFAATARTIARTY